MKNLYILLRQLADQDDKKKSIRKKNTITYKLVAIT